jgi:hypothetical protein
MYTDEAEEGSVTSLVVLMESPFLLPRAGGSSPLVEDDRDEPGITAGSSNCPAGVRSRPPSGLKVSRRKKFVKLSSPYSLTDAHVAAAEGKLRIAGSAGMGEGDLPKRP